MLQQTQVDRVIPFFEAWMRRFPDFAALAAASLDEVLQAWEGLGYYRRARSLHALARVVVERGFVAERDSLGLSAKELIALPGVGAYTAGALLCYAFDEPAAAIDTNVRRVALRVLGEHGREGNPPVDKSGDLVEAWLLGVLKRMGAREGLAAVMDLGALVCTARSPKCGECPLAKGCKAPEVLSEGRGSVRQKSPAKMDNKRAKLAARPTSAVGLIRSDRVWYVSQDGSLPRVSLDAKEGISDPRHALKSWYLAQYQLPVAVRPEHSRVTLDGSTVSLHRCAILRTDTMPFAPATRVAALAQPESVRFFASLLGLTLEDGSPIPVASEPGIAPIATV